MAVIAHMRVPATAFKLGQILDVTGRANIVLENLVPLGEKAVPFFSVHGDVAETFEADVQAHPAVTDIREISSDGDRALYALDWRVTNDTFFQGLSDTDATILTATGGPETWEFELRFISHQDLGTFQEYCADQGIPIELGRIYNPTRPESGPFYGLTEPQRETLVQAVEDGYYSIPREVSTKDLAEQFDISDQAVTERLRRAISTLVDN